MVSLKQINNSKKQKRIYIFQTKNSKIYLNSKYIIKVINSDYLIQSDKFFPQIDGYIYYNSILIPVFLEHSYQGENTSSLQKRIVIFSIENNYCGVTFSNLSQIEAEPEPETTNLYDLISKLLNSNKIHIIKLKSPPKSGQKYLIFQSGKELFGVNLLDANKVEYLSRVKNNKKIIKISSDDTKALFYKNNKVVTFSKIYNIDKIKYFKSGLLLLKPEFKWIKGAGYIEDKNKKLVFLL